MAFVFIPELLKPLFLFGKNLYALLLRFFLYLFETFCPCIVDFTVDGFFLSVHSLVDFSQLLLEPFIFDLFFLAQSSQNSL